MRSRSMRLRRGKAYKRVSGEGAIMLELRNLG
jgi:hypothetical protein